MNRTAAVWWKVLAGCQEPYQTVSIKMGDIVSITYKPEQPTIERHELVAAVPDQSRLLRWRRK
ncbi:MAG TPA: hypothetical protein VKA87_09895 [Nitrososphaeraceae archaeon]|nr:hypothetical protein [Nitrososphaeraceae archaeon]